MSRARKPPRPITTEYLEKVALFYLERYASSADNLARVLMRRVERAARAGIADREEGWAMVAALVERYRASGLLDDRAYAEARARSLHRQGRPQAAIRRALKMKGVKADEIDGALATLAADMAEPDLAAAVAFARRRRLGPYRQENRTAHQARDLAALGRAGFSYEIARRVLAAATPDDLDALLREDGAV